MIRELYAAGGCFWGVEKILSQQPGVVDTSVGYMGGTRSNPTYVEVCTGTTGHAETVRVVFDDEKTTLEALVAAFFENHDPTQLNRQGNDIGSQYRSAIWTDAVDIAEGVKARYQTRLDAAGKGRITTVIAPLEGVDFWLAEDYHQTYLQKNPLGYCNHGFNGVACPSGILS